MYTNRRRVIIKKRSFFRLKTGDAYIDNVFAGFPNGLTMFYGKAGSGKSTLARYISSLLINQGKKVVYICAEKLDDAPTGSIAYDYTSFLPKWQNALNELKQIITTENPSLVVVDSVTRFFSVTNKAIEEADIRSPVFELDKLSIPVIGISQVRGQSAFMHPAGGEAILHAAKLVVKFNKLLVTQSLAQHLQGWNGPAGMFVRIMRSLSS